MASAPLPVLDLQTAKDWGMIHALASTYCLTGKMSIKRSEMEEFITLLGGEVHGSVGSTTKFLIIPNGHFAQGSKYQEARNRGIEILTEAQFVDMITPIDYK